MPDHEDVAFVQGLVDQFLDQVKRRDIDAAANWYAHDAIIFPPGGPRVDGRTGVRDFWQDAAGEIGAFAMTVTDVRRHAADILEEIGVWTMEVRGAPEPLQGKYVSLLRNGPEGWQVITDIWNEGA